MRIRKVLGAAFILISLGLAAWAGAVGWGNQVWLPAGNSRGEFKQGQLSYALRWRLESLAPAEMPPTSALSTVQRFGVGMPYLPNKQVTPAASPPNTKATPPLASKRIYLPIIYSGRKHIAIEAEVVEKLDLGWYLAWQVLETPPKLGGIEFWQVIRVRQDGFYPDKVVIQRAAQANPGATWLIGNEPDVIWQDNVTPARYAEWYHKLYYLLKEADPMCRVAIAGVSQPTPLRLQYLEMVLASYQARYGEPIPVDIWNVHAFILREERGNWGVDIPPGLTADRGILYEVDDHDDLEVFKAQVISFRQWMADHGQRDKPLVISEYGILMPKAYGFGPERVKRFLYGTYDFLVNAADEHIGYPVDDNRLVQRWAWYSLSDDLYPTGSFIDFDTGDLTSLGEAHQEFISNLP